MAWVFFGEGTDNIRLKGFLFNNIFCVMSIEKGKHPSESAAESSYLVMPQHANDSGIAFGGTIMAWIDMLAAIVARRHCEHEVVTVNIDSLSFIEPIMIGEHACLKASVNYVGRTSLEVGVKVFRECPYAKTRSVATKAYLTFVALGEDRRPIPVPKLIPETPDEIRRFESAKHRVESRIKLRELLKTIHQ